MSYYEMYLCSRCWLIAVAHWPRTDLALVSRQQLQICFWIRLVMFLRTYLLKCIFCYNNRKPRVYIVHIDHFPPPSNFEIHFPRRTKMLNNAMLNTMPFTHLLIPFYHPPPFYHSILHNLYLYPILWSQKDLYYVQELNNFHSVYDLIMF